MSPGYDPSFPSQPRTRSRGCDARLCVDVTEGPAAGATLEAETGRVTIGSDETNDLVVADPSVSQFHCCLQTTRDGVLVQDLDSSSGTFVNSVRIREVVLVNGREKLRVGASLVVVHVLGRGTDALPREDRFGPVVGSSTPMRRLFGILERASAADVTVLLEGETGTGKSLIARAIHENSERAAGPMVTVDCASLPPTLIESELFGHERGSFTGAQERRPGAFEAANGGTLFLDEIGELPAELQPKFLRAIEERMVKRIGANTSTPMDIRLVAATNRDLCQQVRDGEFRRDLYYRLDVIRVRVPSLRERPEDIRPLAESFMNDLGQTIPFTLEPSDWEAMISAAWPGNVRELRAAIERSLVLGDKSHLCPDTARAIAAPAPVPCPALVPEIDGSIPFREAKRRVVDGFQREYIKRLIAKTDGNVSAAARLAQMDRNYLRTLIHRYAKPE